MILLLITAALFSLGFYGVLVRRDIIGVLASIEVMLAGPLVLLVAAGALAAAGATAHGAAATGGVVQSFGLIVIVVAAAEAAVGLALLVAVARSGRTTRIDELTEVRG